MDILIACESSGIVRDAFIKRGHNAISCDLLPTEKPGPHYQCDVRDVLYDPWDMIIAFPTCQYIANSGVRWLYTQEGRWGKMRDGALFFKLFTDHPCKKKCVENPIMHKHARAIIGVNYTHTI